MAITLFGSASRPSTDFGEAVNEPGPIEVTPPASMAANDYVLVWAANRDLVGTPPNISVTQAGGQTWTSETQVNQGSDLGAKVMHCRFNGTWSANPTFSTDAETNAFTIFMAVFRGVDTTTAIDVALASAGYAAPSTPFDVTITGITTVTDGAWVIAMWAGADDNTWALQTGGWTNIGGAQIRNAGGSDNSVSLAYLEVATAGGSGNVTNRQTALGGDAGVTAIVALRPATGGGQTIAVGTASETDTALAMGHAKAKAVAGAAETDSALGITAVKSRALGLAVSTEIAMPIGRVKTLAIGPALEVDMAGAVTRVKSQGLGPAIEIDSALPIVKAGAIAIGTAVETDSALGVTAAKAKTIGATTESDTALPAAARKSKGIGTATEADSAPGIGRAKSKAIDYAAELDFALAIIASGGAASAAPGTATLSSRGASATLGNRGASATLGNRGASATLGSRP